MAIIIRGIGKALPLKQMKNTDFPQELDTSDEWIQSHTGGDERNIGISGLCCSSYKQRHS